MIKSVSDAIESVQYNVPSKGQFLFRGQANNSWVPTPSLFRKYPSDKQFAVVLERFLCMPLADGVRLPLSNNLNPIDHLMVLQHFNVPTRLLDWTLDILIALFFACYDKSGDHDDKDGRIFITDRGPYNQLFVNKETDQVFATKLPSNKLHLISEKLATNDLHILEPLIQNPKMRVQNGCFMFFPFNNVDNESTYLDLIKYNRAYNKFIKDKKEKGDTNQNLTFLVHKDVSRDSKKSILKELDEIYGISQETIFVEIDHIKKPINVRQLKHLRHSLGFAE